MKVRCEVEADPSVVDFVWEFNNSGENFEVAPAKFDGNNGTMSELVYTPESERDYGALTCWGRNEIGKQEAPCIYQVIPAGDDISDNSFNGYYLSFDKRSSKESFFNMRWGKGPSHPRYFVISTNNRQFLLVNFGENYRL